MERDGSIRLRWRRCLANAADAIGRDEREERDGGRVAQREALFLRAAPLRLIQLLKALDTRLLHVLPREPATDALVVHLLRLAGLPGRGIDADTVSAGSTLVMLF